MLLRRKAERYFFGQCGMRSAEFGIKGRDTRTRLIRVGFAEQTKQLQLVRCSIYPLLVAPLMRGDSLQCREMSPQATEGTGSRQEMSAEPTEG